MKPLIAISGDVESEPELVARIKLSYVEAVSRAGGIPLMVPPGDAGDVPALLERVDGVVLSGGDDIDPRARGVALHPLAEPMHPRRQAFELALARGVIDRRVPALGICLGMQTLSYAAGGTLHQHLPDAGYADLVDHRGMHEVSIEPGSRLAAILGAHSGRVVSHHHQGVASVPAPFRVTARAPDGVLEAMEAPGERFLVAVQWHPERSPEAEATARLFRALVEAARPPRKR